MQIICSVNKRALPQTLCVCVCVNMPLKFSPLPLLLITTSVLQSYLIRIQFSRLCLSLLLPPLQRRQSEGMAADNSSRAGLSECRKRLTAVHFIMDSYHIQPAMHAKYDSVMKQTARIVLCKCHIFFVSATFAFFFFFFSFRTLFFEVEVVR